LHLFVDISSHGFGHLAITAPVLNTLAKIAPNLRLTVRTRLPRQLLVQRIHVPFELIEASSDFGYVMIDATHIDLPASAAAYRQAHADWPGRGQRRSPLSCQPQARPRADQRQLFAFGRGCLGRRAIAQPVLAQLGRSLCPLFRR
jgi:hypothetical protein